MFMEVLAVASAAAAFIALIITIWLSELSLRKRLALTCLTVGVPALLCLAYYLQVIHKRVGGDFEWQWAGENWLGRISISTDAYNNQKATIDIKRVVKSPDGKKWVLESEPIMWSPEDPAGEILSGSVHGNKGGFTLILPVKQIMFDAQGRRSAPIDRQLEANLRPVEAYTGIVKYRRKNHPCVSGDIVLVRHESGLKPQ